MRTEKLVKKNVKLTHKVESFSEWLSQFDLRSIEELDVSKSSISDEDLATICDEMEGLRSLHLDRTSISDLSCLVYMPNLKEIDISETKVTNLWFLEDLNQLDSLHAYDTEINDLSPLSELPLKEIMIGRSKISDLAPISGMTTLVKIDLDGNVGVNDLSPLSTLVNLEYLSIQGLSTLDIDQLNYLEALSKLKVLSVNPDLTFAAKAILTNLEQQRLNKMSHGLFNERTVDYNATQIGYKSCYEDQKVLTLALSSEFQKQLTNFLKKKGFPISDARGLNEAVRRLDLILQKNQTREDMFSKPQICDS